MKKRTVVIAFALAVAGLAKWKRRTNESRGSGGQLAAGRRKVLVVGATSAIAQHTARLFAAAGDEIFLAGSNSDKLDAVANDLNVRGAPRVESFTLDLNDVDRHPDLLNRAVEALGGLDTVLIAHGTLSDQSACQQSVTRTTQELQTNFLSAVSLLTLLANRFEAQGYGTIAVISSVAGDRGRQSNYVYGAAKAGVSAFLQGLRNRLHRAGVTVITIKPGFVDTPMTAHLEKGPLYVGPDVIARGIYRAIQTGQDVVYLPWFWWGIMAVIKHIPEEIFKKLNL
ncbi:MAG: SDR family oxidoreductase [Anaerolineae bacterium]